MVFPPTDPLRWCASTNEPPVSDAASQEIIEARLAVAVPSICRAALAVVLKKLPRALDVPTKSLPLCVDADAFGSAASGSCSSKQQIAAVFIGRKFIVTA
jgi:hypothetical protein